MDVAPRSQSRGGVDEEAAESLLLLKFSLPRRTNNERPEEEASFNGHLEEGEESVHPLLGAVRTTTLASKERTMA